MATRTLRPNQTTRHGAADGRSARERLLASATELFDAQGVQTVGIDRIIEHAGVAKASLYNLFGNKEGLVRAYLAARHDGTTARLMAAIERHRSPRKRLLAVFEAQGELFRARDFRGCAFVAATAEAPRGGLIERAADDYRSQIRALFTELAEQAGASDPRKLARQLQVIYDGAGLAARMDRDPSIATTARAAAETLLDASL
ncbi:MAG: regulatory protein TetR [Acidimicrobiales bacterium]|jgi:AcrR family transcriptional regulator|nr:regulatory protein TetR [Acidimicrobiales bacterium]